MIDPSEMSFSFAEWIVGVFNRCRLWNRSFQAPYQGIPVRQALMLMRLRGERPALEYEISPPSGGEPMWYQETRFSDGSTPCLLRGANNVPVLESLVNPESALNHIVGFRGIRRPDRTIVAVRLL